MGISEARPNTCRRQAGQRSRGRTRLLSHYKLRNWRLSDISGFWNGTLGRLLRLTAFENIMTGRPNAVHYWKRHLCHRCGLKRPLLGFRTLEHESGASSGSRCKWWSETAPNAPVDGALERLFAPLPRCRYLDLIACLDLCWRVVLVEEMTLESP
jgi:hypothetical protein